MNNIKPAPDTTCNDHVKNSSRKRRGPYQFKSTRNSLAEENERSMPKVTKWRMKTTPRNANCQLSDNEGSDNSGNVSNAWYEASSFQDVWYETTNVEAEVIQPSSAANDDREEEEKGLIFKPSSPNVPLEASGPTPLLQYEQPPADWQLAKTYISKEDDDSLSDAEEPVCTHDKWYMAEEGLDEDCSPSLEDNEMPDFTANKDDDNDQPPYPKGLIFKPFSPNVPLEASGPTPLLQYEQPPADWQLAKTYISKEDDDSLSDAEEPVCTHDKWYMAEEGLDEDCSPSLEDDEMPDFTANKDDDNDQPLYPNAPITLAESMLLILTLCLRHNLTGSCLVDLLTLVSLHCQKPNICKTTSYFFRQYFSNLSMPLKFHNFCSKCNFLIESNAKECPNCKTDIANKSTSNFIEIPLSAQLETFFKRKEFCDGLGHRFNRTKRCDQNIEDIYDGQMYKNFSQPGGFLNGRHNISFMWYVDGIPVFKSSRFAIWPLYFAINELPPKKRMQKQNMLIAGLWYGESKPCMEIFLKPFHTSLTNIFDGISVCDYLGKEITVRGMLLCGTCDMPAKCMVLNMTQFNGLYGCPRCTQSGEVLSVGRGHARVFPANVHNLDGPKRSHLETKQHAEQAFHTNQKILGIKGPSWFLYIMPDIIRGTAIDWMHQVLLGIVRRLLFLWFDSSKSKEPYSISNLVDEVDARLSYLKPPNFISRLPRSIKEHFKYWKASECRSWLFYYSLPVLSGLLPEVFFQHYLLLVEAIYILNGDSLSIDAIDHCEMVLKNFCMMHGTLYSQNQMTSNIHQLLHLCDVVRDLGPLWVYSCFSFESLNGDLLSLFHGTQHVSLQIANNICTLLTEPQLRLKLSDGSPIYEFYQSMKGSISNKLKCGQIDTDCYCVGQLKSYTCSRQEKKSLDKLLGFHFSETIQECSVFSRIMKSKLIICSKRFTQAAKRISYTVSFLHNTNVQYGHITKFVKITPTCTCTCENGCSCSVYFCFIDMFGASSTTMSTDCITAATVQHIVPCNRNEKTLVSVPVSSILSLCVYVDIKNSDTVYVAKCPNIIEGD